MNIICTTNLDDYDCYVTKVITSPRIGERVSVRRKGVHTTLKIVQITHNQTVIDHEPYLVVELNK